MEYHPNINLIGLFAHNLFLNTFHSKKSITGRSTDCIGPLTEPQTHNRYPAKLLACNCKSFGTIYYCSICKYDSLITIHLRKNGLQNTKAENSTSKHSRLFEGSFNDKGVSAKSRSPQLWLLIQLDNLKFASSNHIIFITLQRIIRLTAEQ